MCGIRQRISSGQHRACHRDSLLLTSAQIRGSVIHFVSPRLTRAQFFSTPTRRLRRHPSASTIRVLTTAVRLGTRIGRLEYDMTLLRR